MPRALPACNNTMICQSGVYPYTSLPPAIRGGSCRLTGRDRKVGRCKPAGGVASELRATRRGAQRSRESSDEISSLIADLIKEIERRASACRLQATGSMRSPRRRPARRDRRGASLILLASHPPSRRVDRERERDGAQRMYLPLRAVCVPFHVWNERSVLYCTVVAGVRAACAASV